MKKSAVQSRPIVEIPVPPELEFSSSEKAVKAWDKADRVARIPAGDGNG